MKNDFQIISRLIQDGFSQEVVDLLKSVCKQSHVEGYDEAADNFSGDSHQSFDEWFNGKLVGQ